MHKLTLVVTMATIGFATTCFGYDANLWKPVNGEWNGKWSDKNHWTLGHVPYNYYDENGKHQGEDAVFVNTSGHEIVIEVDQDFTTSSETIPAFIKFNDSWTRKEDLAPVRLVGNGKLTQSAPATIYSYPYSHAIIDDHVEIEWPYGWGVYANSSVEVRGNAAVKLGNSNLSINSTAAFIVDGNAYVTNSTVTLNSEAEMTVKGGTVELRDNITLYDDSVLRIAGGTVTTKTLADQGARQTLEITGGTLNLTASSDLFFGTNETLIHTGGTFIQNGGLVGNIAVLPSSPDGVYRHYETNGIYGDSFNTPFCQEFRGLYVKTNVDKWVRFETSGTLYGGGHMQVCRPYFNGTVVMDLSRIDFMTWGPYCGMIYPRDITLGALDNYELTYSADAGTVAYGKITYETTNYFTGAACTVKNGQAWTPGMEIDVAGNGTLNWKISQAEHQYPSMMTLTVAPGATVARMKEGTLVKTSGKAQRYGRVTLGAGATYSDYTVNHAIEATELTLGAGAKMSFDLTDVAASDGDSVAQGWASYPLVTAAKVTGLTADNITLKNPKSGTDWAIVKAGPNFALRDRNFTGGLTNVFDYTWTNTTDSATACRLDAKENYYRKGGAAQAVPGENTKIFFVPIDIDKSHEVIVPEGGMTVGQISIGGCDGTNWRRASDPFHFTGGKLTLAYNGACGWYTTFYDCTPNPVVFDCDVEGAGARFGVCPYTFVAFNKKFNAKAMPFFGTVVFGGEAVITGSVTPYNAGGYAGSREGSITVMKGGSLSIGNQAHVLGGPMSLMVEDGASATIGGTVWGSKITRFEHLVNGTLSLTAPLQADGVTALFTGTGTVNVASLSPAAESAGTITLRRSLRFNAGALNTASSGGSMKINVATCQKPTLGATADWTYGPAVATTTEAADRALTLDIGAELAIDTTDPTDSSVGHSVTIADPISAAQFSKIVKKGKGTLTIASANTFGTKAGIEVQGGAFTWTAAQTLGSFAASKGATLAYKSVDGSVPTLTVNADVDLSNATIVQADSATRAVAYAAQSLITVPKGCTITGLPASSQAIAFKVVTDPETGAQTLTARTKRGLVMIIR